MDSLVQSRKYSHQWAMDVVKKLWLSAPRATEKVAKSLGFSSKALANSICLGTFEWEAFKSCTKLAHRLLVLSPYYSQRPDVESIVELNIVGLWDKKCAEAGFDPLTGEFLSKTLEAHKRIHRSVGFRAGGPTVSSGG